MRIAYIARKASKNSLFRQFNIQVKGLTDGQMQSLSLQKYSQETPDLYEVSFLGPDNNLKVGERTALWERILDEKFHAFGGIIPMKNSTLPDRVIAKKMSRPKYMKNVFQSTINLAPSGHGPFTYRHLELFWAGAFVLSNPGIREQQLRAPLIEGRDYVAYDDLDDMVDKTRHYLDAEAERKAIARNGRAAYEVLYDVPAHAREIRAALEGGHAPTG